MANTVEGSFLFDNIQVQVGVELVLTRSGVGGAKKKSKLLDRNQPEAAESEQNEHPWWDLGT